MERAFAPSPSWRMSLEGDVVVLSAGADRLYVVDDLPPASAAELVTAWADGAILPGRLSAPSREVVAELLTSGIVVGDASDAMPQSVAVRWVGDLEPSLGRHLRSGIEESGSLSMSDGAAELVLVVRTIGRLVELYDPVAVPTTPHLLLDVAYDHTVSLGPYVVAGETACLACLAGRVGSVWGDPAPPLRPAMLASPMLAAALAVRELEAIARGDFRLANATAAYDLESHRVSVATVYRLPWCPACGGGEAPTGRIELPWVEAP